jgi:hypothetical protein
VEDEAVHEPDAGGPGGRVAAAPRRHEEVPGIRLDERHVLDRHEGETTLVGEGDDGDAIAAVADGSSHRAIVVDGTKDQLSNPWHDESGLFARKGGAGGGGRQAAGGTARELIEASAAGDPDATDAAGAEFDRKMAGGGMGAEERAALEKMNAQLLDGDIAGARQTLDDYEGGGGGAPAAPAPALPAGWSADSGLTLSAQETRTYEALAAARPVPSAEHLDGLSDWSGASTGLNTSLREGGRVRDAHIASAVDAITVPAPVEFTTYRGVPPSAFTTPPQVGQTIADRGYATSALNRQGVEDIFGPQGSLGEQGGWLMRIQAPSGTRHATTAGLRDSQAEDSGHEFLFPEVIFPAGTSMRITAVNPVTRQLDLEVE